MLNFSKILSKSIVGLTSSVILVPFIPSSASAAKLSSLLSELNDIVNIAKKQSTNTSTQLSCTKEKPKDIKSNVLQLQTNCKLNFNVSTNFDIVSAGSQKWRSIFQWDRFYGDAKRDYSLDLTFFGKTSASVSVFGSGDAYARSWVGNLYPNYNYTGLNLYRAFLGSASDSKTFNPSKPFNQKFSGTKDIYLGGAYLGFAELIGLGKLKASSTIEFTSIATITDLGKRRSSRGSVASGASVSDDDFIPVSDDELSNFYENDFSNISNDGVTTSVPEPSQIGGLAALMTMLLATKRSRFVKKHTKESEKLVSKTAVKV